MEYLNKIQEHPAGWWWYYLLSLNILVNGVRSLMCSIDFDPIINVTHSSFDWDIWVVTSLMNLPRDTFANDMDRFLNKLELNSDRDEPSGATTFEYLTNASNELMSVLKENKDLETGGRCTILRWSNVLNTTGATSHQSETLGWSAVQKAHVSKLKGQLNETVPGAVKAKRRETEAL